MSDFVSFAADVGTKLVAAGCQGGGDSKSKPGIVRRAVDFPSLMVGLGFQPAFTFYLSKIERFSAVSGIYSYLTGKAGLDGRVKAELCEELERSEGAGYAGYVAIVLYALNKVGESVSVGGAEEDIYKSLLGIASKELTLAKERLLSEYLLEVKKVLEAMPL
ncbi:type III-B CRISPR module-associated protein Cmr5 [Acidilobus sp.]|uniref:type III-B CRISPR module-associated protein Cmr5 n=1 Tax=Acidilobus sp. TaxID=1872109 RepID=UPI003D00B856